MGGACGPRERSRRSSSSVELGDSLCGGFGGGFVVRIGMEEVDVRVAG
mgnify:CR=1 FL=1